MDSNARMKGKEGRPPASVRPTVEVLALGWRGTGAHAALGAASIGRTAFGLTLGPGGVRHRNPEGCGPDRELLTRGLVGHGRGGHVRE